MAAIELGSTSLFSDANLQAYYKLENVNDSKNSNTLTNNGTTPFNAAVFNNGADGGTSNSSKYLSIASSLSYTGGAYSISFWAKINAAPANNVSYELVELLDSGTSDSSLFISYFNDAGTLKFITGRIRVNVAADTDSHTVDLGTSNFHHFVLSYDGSTVRGYLDNVEVNSVASSGNGSTGLGTITAILAGRSGGSHASAIIDDLAFFNRALTASDVNTIWGGGISSGNTGASFLLNFI